MAAHEAYLGDLTELVELLGAVATNPLRRETAWAPDGHRGYGEAQVDGSVDPLALSAGQYVASPAFELTTMSS